MTTTTAPAPPTTKTTGRLYYWIGLGCVVLGLAFYFTDFFAFKHFVVPWYVPILATAGVLCVLLWFLRRPGLVRGISLALVLLAAGVEWAFVGWISRNPAYAGPAVGEPLPPFNVSRGDGSRFSNSALLGQTSVLVFYRGYW
jgi:hypothetical protein